MRSGACRIEDGDLVVREVLQGFFELLGRGGWRRIGFNLSCSFIKSTCSSIVVLFEITIPVAAPGGGISNFENVTDL